MGGTCLWRNYSGLGGSADWAESARCGVYTGGTRQKSYELEPELEFNGSWHAPASYSTQTWPGPCIIGHQVVRKEELPALRALIVSDIHSNLEALEAVIEDAEGRGGFDIIWCLGDTVGYGPDPGPCLKLLRRHPLLAVAGNHDFAAVGKMGVEDFNYAAKAATHFTTTQLSDQESEFLSELPLVALADPFTLVHGTLRNPLIEYLLDQETAMVTLEMLTTPFCLVGHSHLPFLFREGQSTADFYEFTEDENYSLDGERWIINPGAVGQPRDRDPRSSYAIYDSQGETIERHRVVYDIPATQEKMRQARLPQYLIERLAHGT